MNQIESTMESSKGGPNIGGATWLTAALVAGAVAATATYFVKERTKRQNSTDSWLDQCDRASARLQEQIKQKLAG